MTTVELENDELEALINALTLEQVAATKQRQANDHRPNDRDRAAAREDLAVALKAKLVKVRYPR